MDLEYLSLVEIISAFLNTTDLSNTIIENTDLDRLYQIAEYHQLTAITAYALERLGIKNLRFNNELTKSFWVDLSYNKERDRILEEFDLADIWYMPLKGIVLKHYYPIAGLRQMSDNDILIDSNRAEDVRTIMQSLGYSVIHFGTGHQDKYEKLPLFSFEMHRLLFDSSHRGLFSYYKNIKDKLIKDSENRNGYHFSDEDYYIYMIAHEYKHYASGGTGLRSLLDIYVYVSKLRENLKWEYVGLELSKLGLKEFESLNRKLAFKLFGVNRTLSVTEEEVEFLNYISHSGVHGNWNNKVRNTIAKEGTREYLIKRLIIPMKSIESSYPVFFKYKFLIPLLPLYRVVKGRKMILAELTVILKYMKSKDRDNLRIGDENGDCFKN